MRIDKYCNKNTNLQAKTNIFILKILVSPNLFPTNTLQYILKTGKYQTLLVLNKFHSQCKFYKVLSKLSVKIDLNINKIIRHSPSFTKQT